MNDKDLKILIIDDDPVYRKLSSSILKERYQVFTADRPSAGFQILQKEKIDFVISDYRLPEMDGLMVLENIKKDFPNIELIMISDAGDMNTVIDALRNGAVDYFRKPFTPADLWMSIERTRKYAELRRNYDNERLKNSLLKEEINHEIGVNIVGSSTAVHEIKQQIQMVAQTPDTSVLIIGESGTGKELVARGIHNLSKRRDEFFGAVNMSAIPEHLFESEFFGHKKGSFTGAISDKAGWFETTHKGTLFLDEIGEMPYSAQVKLLRVLEDRSYTKIGTQHSNKFDIRIVAATNKPYIDIANGSDFRLDLFHRIGTFIIHIPPLRDRRNDIPELIHHFVDSFSRKMGKGDISVHPDALNTLLEYDYPGNIRELRNIIERAIILCTGNEILPRHFSLFNHPKSLSKEIFDLEELEKETIIKALAKTNNNKTEAARLLNIEWNALYRRIQKYKIPMNH